MLTSAKEKPVNACLNKVTPARMIIGMAITVNAFRRVSAPSNNKYDPQVKGTINQSFASRYFTDSHPPLVAIVLIQAQHHNKAIHIMMGWEINSAMRCGDWNIITTITSVVNHISGSSGKSVPNEGVSCTSMDQGMENQRNNSNARGAPVR